MGSQYSAPAQSRIILPDRVRQFFVTDIAEPAIEDGMLWLPFTSEHGAILEVRLLTPLARAKKIHQRISEFFIAQEPWN